MENASDLKDDDRSGVVDRPCHDDMVDDGDETQTDDDDQSDGGSSTDNDNACIECVACNADITDNETTMMIAFDDADLRNDGTLQQSAIRNQCHGLQRHCLDVMKRRF